MKISMLLVACAAAATARNVVQLEPRETETRTQEYPTDPGDKYISWGYLVYGGDSNFTITYNKPTTIWQVEKGENSGFRDLHGFNFKVMRVERLAKECALLVVCGPRVYQKEDIVRQEFVPFNKIQEWPRPDVNEPNKYIWAPCRDIEDKETKSWKEKHPDEDRESPDWSIKWYYSYCEK